MCVEWVFKFFIQIAYSVSTNSNLVAGEISYHSFLFFARIVHSLKIEFKLRHLSLSAFTMKAYSWNCLIKKTMLKKAPNILDCVANQKWIHWIWYIRTMVRLFRLRKILENYTLIVLRMKLIQKHFLNF